MQKDIDSKAGIIGQYKKSAKLATIALEGNLEWKKFKIKGVNIRVINIELKNDLNIEKFLFISKIEGNSWLEV